MKQKKLVISVFDESGNVVFQKDGAVMEHVHASVALYADTCSKIILEFPVIDVQPKPADN